MRIIQFLNWDIKSIIESLDDVKKQNFDTIQINPVQPFINETEWWATYQPLDFKIGNVYGSKEDLKQLCDLAHKKNIKIVVDVITNHLANNGDHQATIPNKNINEYLLNKEDFWKKHNKCDDFKSYEDLIYESIGLPGLNLRNEELQNIIINFLNELKECGVDGFRFDAAKHIGLPSDGVTYFSKIKDFLNNNKLFAYAEFLDGPNNLGEDLRNTIYNKKNEFTDLMYILTEEYSNVKRPDKKVTFVESHDTYLHNQTSNKSSDEIAKEYDELTKKYENTLFYVRDLSKGVKVSINNIDRKQYSDDSWINNKIIEKANLNNGNEFKKEEIINMNNKGMDIHHNLSMNIHDVIINQINNTSSVEECVRYALLDYNLQSVANIMLGIVPYDSYLIEYITGEFYKKKWDEKPLNTISYPEFSKKVLLALKSQIVNQDNQLEIDNKIKRLK